MKSSAFTLIELIVVIGIISVLASVVFSDFKGAKERQDVASMADQALALLQQSQAEVASGKLWEVDGAMEYYCQGAYFKVGEVPQMTRGTFSEGVCSSQVLEPYGYSSGNAAVIGISVGGSDLEQVHVFFAPPDGQLSFYNGGEYTGNAKLDFSDTLRLSIDYLTGQFSLGTYEE